MTDSEAPDVWAAHAAIEIEAEPVPASGLVIVRCRGCGQADTLAVPHMVPVAICDPCRVAGVRIEAEPLPRPRMTYALNCFPMQVVKLVAERVPHPAPEEVGLWQRGEAFASLTTPRPVLSLAEMAREAGWGAEVRYARGTGVHGRTGRPTSLQHSYAVRIGGHLLTRDEARAVYVKPVVGGGAWTWRSVWLFGPALPFFGYAGLTQLKEWLRAGGAVRPKWYEEVRAASLFAAQGLKARAKGRAAEGRGRGKPRESGG